MADIAAQLVGKAQETAKKAPRKAKKGPSVGEYIIKASKPEPVAA